MFIYAAAGRREIRRAGGNGGKLAGCFLRNICILTPFYAWCEELRPTRLISPEKSNSRRVGGSPRWVGRWEMELHCPQHLATFCFNFALSKSGSRHSNGLLMLAKWIATVPQRQGMELGRRRGQRTEPAAGRSHLGNGNHLNPRQSPFERCGKWRRGSRISRRFFFNLEVIIVIFTYSIYFDISIPGETFLISPLQDLTQFLPETYIFLSLLIEHPLSVQSIVYLNKYGYWLVAQLCPPLFRMFSISTPMPMPPATKNFTLACFFLAVNITGPTSKGIA